MRQCPATCSAPCRMTACACHGVTFEAVAALARRSRLPFTPLLAAAGMGQTCTACHRDLFEFLAERGLVRADERP